ncbi:N-6 DNA methylase [Novosphingobium flavum]|uniref:site-specific DNA-methyltransferase (adenine-specific) n=1 Tax=Novosphingobium flavum TaxID=1778672 RepID=A0A7X1FU31_9SPHN|nr:N-6 DNA methylase [Novosphingobium flavum]MBC2666981.1 N-6 DNA methylase [Novosphingobium flavum]
MSSHARQAAKNLGAYYTPETMADLLAEWVVQTGDETLLEPSIGDGALIKAVLAWSARKASGTARLRVVGCDIDENAVTAVRDWLPDGHHMIRQNFLEADRALIGEVDGVISNPPFTRNHALPKAERDELRERFGYKGAAGLWVPFVLHAIGFLKPGGRLAAIVPGAALFSNYGRETLERICNKFEHVEIRQIVDKPLWSHHAEERGAIIFARGYEQGACPLPPATRWSAAGSRVADIKPRCFAQALLGAHQLSEIASLSIGVVTGYNKVFLLSEAERAEARIALDDVTLVAARARHVRSLEVSETDLRNLGKHGERTWLLTPRDIERRGTGIRKRLALIPPSMRRSVLWLNKRAPWWKVDQGPGCDAIFTYMNDVGPRIVIGTGKLRCTNTLHQLRFSSELSADERRLVALSMISSFGQLAAEHFGRSYGGGILKFELADARRFPILLHKGVRSRPAFQEADRAIRAGETDEARHIADRLLLPAVFGASWPIAAAEMMGEALRLRGTRRGTSKP